MAALHAPNKVSERDRHNTAVQVALVALGISVLHPRLQLAGPTPRVYECILTLFMCWHKPRSWILELQSGYSGQLTTGSAPSTRVSEEAMDVISDGEGERLVIVEELCGRGEGWSNGRVRRETMEWVRF